MSKNVIDASVFQWSTEAAHLDNAETMNDFIENHLPDEWEVGMVDGSYAEAISDGGHRFALDAKGDGDSHNHIVNIIRLERL